MCGYLLAGVLAQAGDLAAAEQACAATLAEARDVGDLDVLGAVLPVMADLDAPGRPGHAGAHLREAAQLALQTGIWLTILNVLDGCGHLSAAAGRSCRTRSPHGPPAMRSRPARWAPAPRLGCAPPGGRPGRGRAGARPGPGARRRRARRGDEPGHRGRVRLDAHRARPAASPDPAGTGDAQRPGAGVGCPGRPGPHRHQIAAQLYISIRTVRSHLDRIRDKTGARRRADLTRLALSAGLV